MNDEVIQLAIVIGTGFVVGLALDTMFNFGHKHGRRDGMKYQQQIDDEVLTDLESQLGPEAVERAIKYHER